MLIQLQSFFWNLLAQTGGQGQTNSAGNSMNSMMAGSPMNDYTAGVALYVLVIGLLVAVVLIGGILVVNLGLMSKRQEDRIGGRNPSDVGILKHTMCPGEADDRRRLPAEESPDGAELGSDQPRRAA